MNEQITINELLNEQDDSLFTSSDIYNEQEEDVSEKGLVSIREMAISGTDWTTETIVRQIEKGNIILDPEFQRRDAWTRKKKSRFIESLFLGFPIPQIILAEQKEKKGKFIVIDGKQRLLSLQQFMREDDTQENTLKLMGLEVKPELNGKTYRKMIDLQMDSEIDEFANQPIRTVVVKNWPTVEVLYLIFLRLNTGSIRLSPQELRQALYPGGFIQFANEAASNSQQIKRMLKLKPTALDFRMRDVEILIRYMAFSFFSKAYSGSMQDFLDNTCEKLNKEWTKKKEEIEDRYAIFEEAVDCVYAIFGKNAFSKYKDGHYEGKVNRAVIDIMLFYFSDKSIRDKAIFFSDKVLAGFEQLCVEDTNFLDAVEQTTKSKQAVSYRFNKWAEVLGASISELIESPFSGERNDNASN